MENLEKLLKEFNEVSDYRITTVTQESYELFFVHEKLETVRSTETMDKNVTIYVDHKKYRGDSTFVITKSDNEASLREKIKSSIEKALLINNKKYKLPSNEVNTYSLESNFGDYSMKELGTNIYNILVECTSNKKATLNASEIFLYKTVKHIVNNCGLDKTQTKYKAMIETIPTFDTKKDSVEIYTQLNFSNYDKKWIKNQINEALKDVTKRSRAKKPNGELKCNVLLRSSEIAQLVGAYVNNLNYQAVYNKSNSISLGSNIQENSQGDKLDVILHGQLKNSAYSEAFDADGISLKKKKVIKDGIVINYFGANRFAQYLHKKPTGSLNLIEVKKGTHSLKEFMKEPYLECASFSGLQVDIDNDYIGGEVRLAYYNDLNKIYPITGISISAKLSEVLKSIELSNKVVTNSYYKVPQYALLKNVKIF